MNYTDYTLLHRWREQGDAKAFDALARRHGGMVYATALRILNNPADAEDITQEAFLTLARGGDIRRNVAAWLHRVATNRAITFLRSDARRRNREKVSYPDSVPIDLHEWKEVCSILDETIESLPERQRCAVVAHFLEGLTHEEIATSLGISRPAVSKRIARGVEQIRLTLATRGVRISVGAISAGFSSLRASSALPAALVTKLGAISLAGSNCPTEPDSISGNLSNLVARGRLLRFAAAACVTIALLSLIRPVERSGTSVGETAVLPELFPQIVEVTETDVPSSLAGDDAAVPEVPGAAEFHSADVMNHSARVLRGRVFDSTSRAPLENMIVVAAPWHPLTRVIDGRRKVSGTSTAELAYDPNYTDVIAIPDHPFEVVGWSDAAGMFEGEVREAGEYLMLVMPDDGYAGSAHQIVATESAAEIEFPVVPLSIVQGTVTVNGEPVPHARLHLHEDAAFDAVHNAEVHTDAHGRFELSAWMDLPITFRGHLSQSEGGAYTSLSATVVPVPGRVVETELTFFRGSCSVSGRIYRARDGQSVGAKVRLVNLYEEEPAFRRTFARVSNTPEGSFFASDLVEGPAILELLTNEDGLSTLHRRRLDITAGEEARVDVVFEDTVIGVQTIDLEASRFRGLYAFELAPGTSRVPVSMLHIEYALRAVARLDSGGLGLIAGLPYGRYALAIASVSPEIEMQGYATAAERFENLNVAVSDVVELTASRPEILVTH